VTLGDAEAHRPAVVLNVHAEASEADLLKEGFDDLGRLAESVRQGLWGRHLRIPEAWIFGCDYVEAAGERRDEVSILVRGCREAVQQQEFRVPGFASLAVEDVQSVDIDSP
jgi:hypothetical protein